MNQQFCEECECKKCLKTRKEISKRLRETILEMAKNETNPRLKKMAKKILEASK